MVAKLSKGYNCKHCNAYHEFPMYVYAHWDIWLTAICTECGAEHEMLRGKTRLIKKGKKDAGQDKN